MISTDIRCAVLLAAAAIAGAASAQTPDSDIDAVQRKLDAAKQAQAAKDAAAKREADQRAAALAAERRQRDAAAAADAQKGTMIVKSGTRCELSVNGESQGWLEAEATRKVKVDAGEQLIECNAGDGREVEQTEEIDSGKQSVVRLTMPALERFTRVAEGIADREQNLVWASADNGSDINWGDAGRYCTAKGSGWGLATVAALQSLYDDSGAHAFSWTGPVSGRVYAIKPATSLIRLSSGFFWSNEPKGSSEAWLVVLNDGHRLSDRVDNANGARALCVRRA